jgi:hypothetical protein
MENLGNDFFLMKFSNPDDRDFALYGGPWMVADHYVTMRQWHLNFDLYQATIHKVAVWV